MQPIKEENKFLVVKMEDIVEYFSDRYGINFFDIDDEGQKELNDFKRTLRGIQENRNERGKGYNRYIVVNQDEPYAEDLWRAILVNEELKADKKLSNSKMDNNSGE